MDWKPEDDPVAVGQRARRAEPGAHPDQLHHLPPVSCDDNNEAHRVRPQIRRRLRSPSLDKTVAAPASGAIAWTELDERDREARCLGAASEFPAGALDARRQRLAARLRAAAGRRPLALSRAPPATGRRRRSSPTCAGRPRSRRATRCTSPPRTRWRATPPACWSRATRAGRPRSKATPTIRTAMGATSVVRAGADPGPVRRRARQGHAATQGARIAWRTLLADRWPSSRSGWPPNGGAGLRFLVEPERRRRCWRDLRSRILQNASPGQVRQPTRRSPPTALVEGARWRSAARWSRATT